MLRETFEQRQARLASERAQAIVDAQRREADAFWRQWIVDQGLMPRDGQSIKGDKGDKGDPGADGQSIKGDKGDKGDPGADGQSIKGDKGDKGDPGTDGVWVLRTETQFESNHPAARVAAVIDYLSNGTTRTRTVRRNAAGRPIALE